MTTKIPDDLIEQIYERNAVLFVGAGLSTGSGLPTWSKLMYLMIDWAKKHRIPLSEENERDLIQLIEQNKFLIVAQELRERMDVASFKKFMESVFRNDANKPSPAHMILPEIPFAAVLTTNYDVLLESAYSTHEKIRPRIYTQQDTSQLASLDSKNEFYILKVHGDIDRIETVVLGRRDYQKVMFADEPYRELMRSLFKSKTIFFVGFGLTDPDLNLLFDERGTLFENYGRTHYALMSTKEANPIEINRWDKDYGIQIIPYDATEGHPEVLDILLEISRKVDEKIVSPALDTVWHRLPHLNFTVQCSNLKVLKLFVGKLIEKIQREPRNYLFFVAQMDMKEISEQNFFRMLSTRIFQTIEASYPSTKTERDKIDIENIENFKKEVENMISEIGKNHQKEARIILFLLNADVMNEFSDHIKNKLRCLLEHSPTIFAVIVAQNLQKLESSRAGSPLLDIFAHVNLDD